MKRLLVPCLPVLLGAILAACKGNAIQEDPDSLVNYRPDYHRGMKIYNQSCSACHDSGMHEAPTLDDVEEWEDRGLFWPSLLQQHVHDGYLGMPAMGSSEGLGKRAIADAIYYMRVKVESASGPLR